MPLPVTTDSLDSVPEALRAAYVEKEGKFHLDADMSGFTKTLEDRKSRQEKATQRAAELERELAEMKRKVEEADIAAKGLTDFRKKWDDEQLKPVLSERDTLKAKVHELTFGTQMDALLADADVVNLKASRKLLDDLFALNDKGELAPKDDPTADPAQHLAKLKVGEYAFAFKGTQAAGGGAGGIQNGNAPNTVKPVEKWTSEERESYINQNGPDKFRQLLDQRTVEIYTGKAAAA